MKIFISGGAGTLGSNIAKKFQEENIEFLIIDNFETSSINNLQGIPSNKIKEGSILDRKLLEEIFQSFKPTHIIHAAASYKDPNDFEKDASVNINGSIIIAEWQYAVKKIIIFKQRYVMGDQNKYLFLLKVIVIHLQVMVFWRVLFTQ